MASDVSKRDGNNASTLLGIDDSTAEVRAVKVSSAGAINISGATTNTPPVYSTVACGELAGNVAATQLPSVACKLARFKALSDNAGKVYLGGAGVTVANGATDTTTGLQLSAGDDTGWIPVSNLNLLYRICDNAGDDLTYLAVT